MAKKKLKGMIAVIGILILISTIVYICMGKNTFFTSVINRGRSLFAPGSAQAEDGSITYSTDGDDSANYKDGDTSGEKSKWIKNGDIWTYTFYVDDPNAQWYVYEDSSTLMDGYTGDYTEYNPDKLFTEEELDSFTPTAEMTVSTDDSGNNVYTWVDSNNSYKVIDNGDGTYKKITTKLSLTITNYKVSEEPVTPSETIKYGDLTINKVVKDSEGTVLTEDEDSTNFVFTITLTADENHQGLVDGTKVYGGIVFKDGVGTVSLKAGGTTTISGIPEGLSYAVKERVIDGYDTSCETRYYGVIDEDAPGVVTYVNTLKSRETPGPQSSVNVTLRKTVTGNNEISERYDFEITLDNLKPDTTYSLSNGDTFTTDSIGSANVSVALGNNESVVIQNIPVGSKYKVYEYAGDYISSYVIADANNVGLINNSSSANTKTNTALATSTETADEGEDITITFNNQKRAYQNLKIEKVVTDEEDDSTYIFNVEFANMQEGESFNSSVGKVIAEPDGKAELTIYLAGGESAEFYDILVGTTYKVTELASSSIASYRVVDANNGNKIVSTSGANQTAREALSTETETVNQGEEVTVTFINDTVNQEPDSVTTSIGVSKIVVDTEGNEARDCNEEFTFEITAENESNPMPENSTIRINGNGEASFGTITFGSTGTYTYKVVEKSGDGDKFIYDDTEYTIVYEVTNEQGLLEVSKTVKKDGFNGDSIVFTNIIKDEDPDSPDTPDTPDNPDEPEKPEDKKDNPGKEENKDDSKKESTNNKSIKTGDSILIMVLIGALATIVLVFLGTLQKNIKNTK